MKRSAAGTILSVTATIVVISAAFAGCGEGGVDSSTSAGTSNKDWSEEAQAQVAGIDASHKQCGGFAGARCVVSEFCNVERALGGQGCHVADATGVCQPLPSCTPESSPVCGCDGKTYDGPCLAHAAGMSIDHPGKCAGDGGAGTICGGFAGRPCGKGEFCNFEGTQLVCGRWDGTGVCTEVPEVCTLQIDPVCGCDGKTYDNPCIAHRAGISVEHRGNCRGTGTLP